MAVCREACASFLPILGAPRMPLGPPVSFMTLQDEEVIGFKGRSQTTHGPEYREEKERAEDEEGKGGLWYILRGMTGRNPQTSVNSADVTRPSL